MADEEEEEVLNDSMNGDAGCRVRELLARGRALQEELRARAGGGGPIGVVRLQKLVRSELSFLTRLASLPLPSKVSSCPALRRTDTSKYGNNEAKAKRHVTSVDSSQLWVNVHRIRKGSKGTESTNVTRGLRKKRFIRCPTEVVICSNLDHLVDVFRILQHPLVDGVSAVMQKLAVDGGDTAHVDIAGMIDGKPVWLILSSRNPRYIRWSDTGKHVKGLKARLLLLLHAASANVVRQPESIFLCFAGRVPEEVDSGLRDEFGAVHVPSSAGHEQQSSSGGACRHSSKFGLSPDHFNSSFPGCEFSEVEGGDWLEVEVKKDTSSRWNQAWETYEIRIQNSKGPKTEECAVDVNNAEESEGGGTGGNDDEVSSLSSQSRAVSDQRTSLVGSVQLAPDQAQEQSAADDCQKLVNLDTTALVALVSEVSNGCAEYLLALPEADLEKRFPSMSAFIREQALSELEKALLPEIEDAMAARQPIVSKYVYDEFRSIVSVIGGPKEKDRARVILERVRVVPDRPSNRVMSLPLSGRIKRRHKIVFGTGDFFKAPTLTANMSFVRAARDKGMPIATLEHRPRALTGD